MGVFDSRSIYRDPITITVVAPSGDQFRIADPHQRGQQSVLLLAEGFDGGEGKMDHTTHETVTRYGVRRTGFKVPPISGSLNVLVTDDVEDLSVAFRRWRAAWSYTQPGKLKVEWRDGHTSEIEVVLADAAPLPSSFVGLHVMEDEIKWENFSGVWSGGVTTYTGNVTVTVPGDLPPKLRLRWDGQATAFTLPSGLSMSLATGPGVRWINLERGMQGQVTDEDGNVDTGTWSSLRGVLVGETLQPHTKNDFQLGAGLTLEVTPRYLSPWR